MNGFRIFSLLGSIALLVAWAGAQPVEEPTTTTAPATLPTQPATAPTTAPIPLAAIVGDIEKAVRTVRRIEADLAGDVASLPGVADELPVFARELTARAGEVQGVIAARPSIDTLRQIDETYRDFFNTLDGWRRDLNARAQRLDDNVMRLSETARHWEVRAKEARDSASPPEVVKRIEDLLASTYATWKQVETHRNRILGLQTEVTQQINVVSEVVIAAKTAREAAVTRLLERDAAPIWSPHVREEAGGRMISRGQESFSNHVQALSAYSQRNVRTIVAHGVIMLLIIASLFWVRLVVLRWLEKEPNLKDALLVFLYPAPTGLMLGILVSVWLYPQAPVLLRSIFAALLLIPAVVLLRRLLGQRFYPVLNALVVTYIVDQTRFIATSQPTLNRLIFLTEMAGAFVFIIVLMRSGRLAAMMAERHPQLGVFMRIAARLAGVLFLAALLSNAVGFESLGTLIGDATLRCFRAALVLYALVQILDGLVMGMLRVWPFTLSRMITRQRPFVHRWIVLALRWGALVLWLLVALERFAIRDLVLDVGRRVLYATVSLGALQLSIANVLTFAFTVWAAFALSRFIRFALQEDVYPRVHLPGGLPYAISNMLHYLVLMFGFITAVSALGYDLTKFTLLAGAFGVGLGFGLQNIVNNFISGIILLFERPVKVGDVVQIGPDIGTISRIGIRASTVRTTAGSDIIVPNSQFISASVVNWTLSTRQRGLTIPVSVASNTDPAQVIALLEKTAADHPQVAENPKPQALMTTFNAAQMTFEVQVWTRSYEDWQSLRSALGIQIMRALAKEEITLK